MPRRTLAFILFAIVLALGCVRLGVWQLSRLEQRRARNALVTARLREAPAPFAEVARDPANARYRQVKLAGRYDYEHELVLTSRTRQGSPGVHILTPLLLPSSDTAVLINRGWVYAPDAMRADLSRWREWDSATVVGFVDEFATGTGPVSTPSVARGVRRADRDSIASELPYALAPLIVVQRLGAATASDSAHPSRVDVPPLDEGPHKSYAFQWFAFAAIAVIGTGVVSIRPKGRAERTARNG